MSTAFNESGEYIGETCNDPEEYIDLLKPILTGRANAHGRKVQKTQFGV